MLLDLGRTFPLDGVRFGVPAGRDGPLCDDLDPPRPSLGCTSASGD